MTAPFEITRVSDLVQSCLAALVASAAGLSVSLPSRQIAAAGSVPYDCSQVVVTVIQIGTGTPEPTGPRTGMLTYPNADSNSTLYQATIQLAIVRGTHDTPTGPLGQTAPTPAAYLANLTNASQDAAALIRAVNQIAENEMSAVPRTVTIGTPQGGLVATSARITVLV